MPKNKSTINPAAKSPPVAHEASTASPPSHPESADPPAISKPSWAPVAKVPEGQSKSMTIKEEPKSSWLGSGIKWLGFPRGMLSAPWKAATDAFVVPGGEAEKKLGGRILEVEINSRNGNPVHKSEYNKSDPENVISARVRATTGEVTCHVYIDGRGTTSKWDARS